MIKKCMALAAGLLISAAGYASSLGVYGNVYPISEEDAVDMIKSKLTDMQNSGELDAITQRFKEKNLAAIEDPPPVPGITASAVLREFHYDPSFAFPEDVKTPDGQVIVQAGQVLNPLAYRSLSKGLIFLDGTDPAQVEIARRHKESNPRDSVILTAGSYIRLSREFNSPVFYDQRGILTTKFGIKSVPAYVKQDGLKLLVSEFPISFYASIKKVD